MIHEELKPLLERLRINLIDLTATDLSFKSLEKIADIDTVLLRKYVSGPEMLVELLLEHELNKFIEMASVIDPESNAIDALLAISQDVSRRFEQIFPSVSPQLKVMYPDAYQLQFEKRLQSISSMIKLNLDKGIEQGLYRGDLSSELIARLYISRLIDIHNSDLFPTESFSFEVLFNQMFESLIRSVATAGGLTYFEKQKLALGL